jgi:hypothetical protein
VTENLVPVRTDFDRTSAIGDIRPRDRTDFGTATPRRIPTGGPAGFRRQEITRPSLLFYNLSVIALFQKHIFNQYLARIVTRIIVHVRTLIP